MEWNYSNSNSGCIIIMQTKLCAQNPVTIFLITYRLRSSCYDEKVKISLHQYTTNRTVCIPLSFHYFMVYYSIIVPVLYSGICILLCCGGVLEFQVTKISNSWGCYPSMRVDTIISKILFLSNKKFNQSPIMKNNYLYSTPLHYYSIIITDHFAG